jgi:DNA-binding CsgD family transcriptional regulator
MTLHVDDVEFDSRHVTQDSVSVPCADRIRPAFDQDEKLPMQLLMDPPKVVRPTAPLLAPLDALSPREGTILQLIGQGKSNKEIARVLGIAPETVKSHVKHIFLKLAVAKRAQAVSRAYSFGLFSSS